ncbi:MAG TPA: pyridoxal phosphate-dependent aminotransferase [Kofleriaceae bacterium]|nr:pyridoxal phosphate-dependent aminotransferase [Kofleriaceae bacterium]
MGSTQEAPAQRTESAVREFFMEEYLESIRLERFNLGESGARSVTVEELLTGVGLAREQIAQGFLAMELRNSPNWGRDDLRDRVAALHPGATREDVLITTGTSEALLLLFRQLRPRRVALAMPAFQALYEIPRTLGAEIVPLPIQWSDRGAPFIDREQWRALLDRARPDCLILNSPHNPSGLVLDGDLCEELLDFARATGATVVADEHYRFHASEHEPLGPTLHRPGGRVFVTGSFIKCLGCTGLRIGWCVGDHAALAAMQNDKNYTTHTVAPIVEWIALEVMRRVDSPILQRMRAEWIDNRRALGTFLAASPALEGVAPAGGFVTCVGVRGAREQADVDAAARALAAEGVFLLGLDKMEAADNRHAAPGATGLRLGLGFRLGLGLPPADFREALARIERALARGGAVLPPR